MMVDHNGDEAGARALLRYQRQAEQQQAALNESRREAEFWRAQAMAMRQSTSWRITAGLRRLASWLRRAPAQSPTTPPSPVTAASNKVLIDVHWLLDGSESIEQVQTLLDSLQDQTHAAWSLSVRSASGTLPSPISALVAPALREPAPATPGHLRLQVLLDGALRLNPQALQILASQAQALHTGSWPQPIMLYADHAAGQVWHKPEWSPWLACEVDLIGPLLAWCSTDASPAQPPAAFDSALQAAFDGFVRGACIRRLPHVLSDALPISPSRQSRQRQAVQRYLAQRQPAAFAGLEPAPEPRLGIPRFKNPLKLATLIIPTRDKADLLDACVQSLFDHPAGMDYEILVIDNGSVEPATQALFDRWASDPRIRVLRADCAFNWSLLNNLGRQQARGDLLVFLNNDTLIRQADWLGRMAEVAALPDVGVVGPMLLYPDDTIQHAGVVVGLCGWAEHVYKGMLPDAPAGVFGTPAWSRNVLAVTGACLAITTARFDELGGFDESFIICGSDVEIGLRAHRQGLWNVYLADVSLYHLESKTRSPHVPEVDFVQSALKYAPYREQGDPFHHPRLNRQSCMPVLAEVAP